MKKVENCKLISKTKIIDGIFDFVIESEDISKEAQCGQFLHINCGDSTFLRRPISICDAENGKVRFIFEVKGKGTEELAKKEVGDYIDVMGPLGHGFEIKDSVKNAVIIGGGIGVFPLYKLAKNINADVFLGSHKCDMIYSCGPMPMLKAVKKIAESRGIKCQVSLEQRMGCGIGACLVCSCETNKEGTDRYAKVCTNGPVFYSEEVTLND